MLDLIVFVRQANQREEEYKNQIKTLNNRLKEVHADFKQKSEPFAPCLNFEI